MIGVYIKILYFKEVKLQNNLLKSKKNKENTILMFLIATRRIDLKF